MPQCFKLYNKNDYRLIKFYIRYPTTLTKHRHTHIHIYQPLIAKNTRTNIYKHGFKKKNKTKLQLARNFSKPLESTEFVQYRMSETKTKFSNLGSREIK